MYSKKRQNLIPVSYTHLKVVKQDKERIFGYVIEYDGFDQIDAGGKRRNHIQKISRRVFVQHVLQAREPSIKIGLRLCLEVCEILFQRVVLCIALQDVYKRQISRWAQRLLFP